jgi:ketosteroid isomerase-like protein
MKKYLFLSLLSIAIALVSHSRQSDESKIRAILQQQTEAWNAGNLELFMQGYWKSDSLLFIGSSGVTYGWQKTLDNYKRGYPNRQAMGILKFEILKVQRLSADHFFVVGKWMLQREVGNLSGHYTLIWRLIEGEWKIVSDHSS